MTETPAVDVENLVVRFHQRDRTIYAVNGVSFRLARGEVLGILGESGSGKTVTLRSLMRLLPHNCAIGGRVVLDGEDVTAASESRLEELRGNCIAMIFQEPATALDPVFTIGQQITETLVRHQGMPRGEARRRALEWLERVQIPSARRRLDSYPHEMSGGMRQRAMIALALSCNPTVLLADEPTTALDVTVQIQILLLLRELQRELGMAVVFVTHDVGAAVEVSDRLAVMYAGRFVETGAARDVLTKRAHPYTGPPKSRCRICSPASPPRSCRRGRAARRHARCMHGIRRDPMLSWCRQSQFFTPRIKQRHARLNHNRV